MSGKSVDPSRVLLGIMLAVFVWGALLALGAFLFGGLRHGAKAALILGCVMAFLAGWGALLRHRARKSLNANSQHASSRLDERP